MFCLILDGVSHTVTGVVEEELVESGSFPLCFLRYKIDKVIRELLGCVRESHG